MYAVGCGPVWISVENEFEKMKQRGGGTLPDNDGVKDTKLVKGEQIMKDKDMMADDQIVELYWQRNEAAIGKTEKKYGTYCRAIAMNILQDREDAGECVNDTWLKAWNAIPPARPRQLKLFLARITRNLALNRLEEKSAEKRGGGQIFQVLDELVECVSTGGAVEEAILEEELRRSINQFVRQLPERDCNVFVRRYFFVDSIEEIGSRYGMTKNHVMVSLSRTRRKLKDHLRQEGYSV